MKLLLYPAFLGLLVMLSWLAIAAVEVCVLGATDAKFDCLGSLQIVFAFSLIGAGLAGLAGLALRLAVSRALPVSSVAGELAAAAHAALGLVLAISAIIYFRVGMSLPVAGRLVLWSAVCLAVCALSLRWLGRRGDGSGA